MSITCDTFKIAEISDIHFGNGRLSSVRVYEHLQKVLYPLFKDIKLLIINGDTFDTLLNMNNEAGFYVARFIDDLTTLALFHKVYIRVVRGTFSHDRYQNQFFVVRDKGINTLNGIPMIRVIDKISIEHFDELNINVLYCPDDQPHVDLSQAVIDVITANHLDKVDLLFSHGYFTHLLPKNLPHIPHNTLDYDKLKKYVDGLFVNGHVHHPVVYDNRVITSGSFERMNHDNDNTPVGMWILTGTRHKTKFQWTYEFIENKDAIPFTTFHTEKYTSGEFLCKDIQKYMDQLRKTDYPVHDPVYIRIQGETFPGVTEWIHDHYLNIIITDKKTQLIQEVTVEDQAITSDDLPVLTEDNLAQVVFNNLSEEDGMTLEEVQEIINEL